jgi:hypothetical protein
VAWLLGSPTQKNHNSDLQTYDAHFDVWVTNVQQHLQEQHRKAVTFGVAAKLVSTYLKSVFVLTGWEGTPSPRERGRSNQTARRRGWWHPEARRASAPKRWLSPAGNWSFVKRVCLKIR